MVFRTNRSPKLLFLRMVRMPSHCLIPFPWFYEVCPTAAGYSLCLIVGLSKNCWTPIIAWHLGYSLNATTYGPGLIYKTPIWHHIWIRSCCLSLQVTLLTRRPRTPIYRMVNYYTYKMQPIGLLSPPNDTPNTGIAVYASLARSTNPITEYSQIVCEPEQESGYT